MANGATQNPANKVGRNSGAGPTGISAFQPTAAEAARGLEPMGQNRTGWTGRLGMGFGAIALVGSASAYLWKRVRQPKGFRARIKRMIRR
jgi:hypothetical protein